jgi:hypothetical protein
MGTRTLHFLIACLGQTDGRGRSDIGARLRAWISFEKMQSDLFILIRGIGFPDVIQSIP